MAKKLSKGDVKDAKRSLIDENKIKPGSKSKSFRKKEFEVECRYIGTFNFGKLFDRYRDWHRFRKYSTIEEAKRVVELMNHKELGVYEYRLGTPSEAKETR